MLPPSPCMGVCRIDEASGLCTGCARTVEEIAAWRDAGPDALDRIWAALPKRRARLGLRLYRLGWGAEAIRDFVIGTLRDGGGAWMFGEVSVALSSQASLAFDGDRIEAVGATGALRFEVSGQLRAFAVRDAAGGREAIVLAAARGRARMEGAPGLAALGTDSGALREADRGLALYDTGAGGAFARLLVRTEDAGLMRDLEPRIGQPWPAIRAALGDRLHAARPVRIAATLLGRAEGFAGQAGPALPSDLALPDAFAPCGVFLPAGFVAAPAAGPSSSCASPSVIPETAERLSGTHPGEGL